MKRQLCVYDYLMSAEIRKNGCLSHDKRWQSLGKKIWFVDAFEIRASRSNRISISLSNLTEITPILQDRL